MAPGVSSGTGGSADPSEGSTAPSVAGAGRLGSRFDRRKRSAASQVRVLDGFACAAGAAGSCDEASTPAGAASSAGSDAASGGGTSDGAAIFSVRFFLLVWEQTEDEALSRLRMMPRQASRPRTPRGGSLERGQAGPPWSPPSWVEKSAGAAKRGSWRSPPQGTQGSSLRQLGLQEPARAQAREAAPPDQAQGTPHTAAENRAPVPPTEWRNSRHSRAPASNGFGAWWFRRLAGGSGAEAHGPAEAGPQSNHSLPGF